MNYVHPAFSRRLEAHTTDETDPEASCQVSRTTIAGETTKNDNYIL